AGLKSFIAARRSSLLAQLAEFGCSASAVSKVENGAVAVFPNPASGKVFIQTNGEILSKINLFSLDGRLLKTWQASGEAVEISLDEFSAGMYFLKMDFAQGGVFGKIILE
ncbi:MAG: T9SS type A sorting domain-containing protein, partial [Bacteroidota bacterium]